jgi:AraC family transcriptional regulator of adaptative response/methylated-DNA-[protein]-cysteine methyltransferase
MNDAARWHAVATRDPRREHEFVYAVRSTGIFCRASCPSRRPGRSQVAFYATPAEAQSAGFRPCRRCRPESGGAQAWIETVRRAIAARLDGPVRLKDLASAVGTSPSQLQRRFRALSGLSPRQYAEALRTERLKQELRRAPRVVDAVYESGFGSGSRVYESAATRLGMTPGAYRRGGAGVTLRFTIVSCPLGQLLVAASEAGLVAVTLGDTREELENALREEYPNATLARDDRGLRARALEVRALLDENGRALRRPLDVPGTPFEREVWEEIQRIPRGQTRTYAEIARRLGRPGAARAVGRACGRNRVALVIPCHRVVPAAGGRGGYRWGPERKRALLERERPTKAR